MNDGIFDIKDPDLKAKFQEYKKLGINIFDPKDPVFTDKCFNIELRDAPIDYDLPQKYLINEVKFNSIYISAKI